MPDPGKKFIKSSKEADVDDDFQQEMKKMVEEVFTLGNSLVRSTNGTRLTCEDLFKSCVNLVKNAQHNQFHTLCSLHKAQQSIVDEKVSLDCVSLSIVVDCCCFDKCFSVVLEPD